MPFSDTQSQVQPMKCKNTNNGSYKGSTGFQFNVFLLASMQIRIGGSLCQIVLCCKYNSSHSSPQMSSKIRSIPRFKEMTSELGVGEPCKAECAGVVGIKLPPQFSFATHINSSSICQYSSILLCHTHST